MLPAILSPGDMWRQINVLWAQLDHFSIYTYTGSRISLSSFSQHVNILNRNYFLWPQFVIHDIRNFNGAYHDTAFSCNPQLCLENTKCGVGWAHFTRHSEANAKLLWLPVRQLRLTSSNKYITFPKCEAHECVISLRIASSKIMRQRGVFNYVNNLTKWIFFYCDPNIYQNSFNFNW